MKVVINSCYGGFSLSPEATLELYKRGGKVDATPIAEYWRDLDDNSRFGYREALRGWREYRAGGGKSFFLKVFSEDERLVLNARDTDRHDPILVELVEEMGNDANGQCAHLNVVEIPDGVDYVIEEYDGLEHVAERHRTWS
jgi:hypothetical protein